MKQIRVDAPNYTQTPNVIFATAPEMGEAELRVTLHVIRKTFGWHKLSDEISLTQFEDGTGLSRQSVINGIAQALKRGTVKRRKHGLSFRYSAIVHEVDYPTHSSQRSRLPLVNVVDQSDKAGSLLSRPPHAQKVAGQVDTQKKVLKKEKVTKEQQQTKGVVAADESILKSLDQLHIEEPTRTELAQLPHVNGDYLDAIRGYSKKHPQLGPGYYVNQIRLGWKPSKHAKRGTVGEDIQRMREAGLIQRPSSFSRYSPASGCSIKHSRNKAFAS